MNARNIREYWRAAYRYGRLLGGMAGGKLEMEREYPRVVLCSRYGWSDALALPIGYLVGCALRDRADND